MNLIARFMRFFFYHLYHRIAFAYDFVAASVSFGNWKNWTQSVIPFISGTRVLELGHGPGHLHRILLDRELDAVAMDESIQMGKLARRNAGKSAKLTRGIAQNIPFASGSFDSIISTFPSEYIFDAKTLSEAFRVLRDEGNLIVLPAVWPQNGFLKWLYKITGESPSAANDAVKNRFKEPFARAGFNTEIQTIDVQSGVLLLIVAKKRGNDVEKITRAGQ